MEKKIRIELKKGTSILNISYKDKDKNSILPVLEKLSSTYQNYSGERNKKINQFSQDSLENRLKVLVKKVQFFKTCTRICYRSRSYLFRSLSKRK